MRQPTPRDTTRKVPSTRSTVLFTLLIVACFSVLLWACLYCREAKEADARPEHVITHDSLGVNYTYNGEEIRWYVFTDPDTGEQYLVNDRGGCTPRLDKSEQ